MRDNDASSPDIDNSSHQLVGMGAVDDDDPALAIASMWEGARRKGIHTAFGDPYLFKSARRLPLPSLTCVGARHPLIMPLVFNSRTRDPSAEEEDAALPPPVEKSTEDMKKEHEELVKADEIADKEKTTQEAMNFGQGANHFVLAVAERNPNNEAEVHITYMNSASTPSKAVIRATARNIVRNSFWMPAGIWPQFTQESWRPVPQQKDAIGSGTHVIMNAWAILLGLSINGGWSRSGKEQSAFYKEACTVINLALKGHMDGETVLSFLTAYGYARSRHATRIPELPRRVHSFFMNHDVLSKKLQEIREEERDKARKEVIVAPGGLAPIDNTGRKLRGTTGSSKPPGSDLPPTKQKVWYDRMTKGIHDCEAKRKALRRPKLTVIRARQQLLDDDVVLAIATVWRGLWENNIRFAFGISDLFRLCRQPSEGDDWHGVVAVGAPHAFIMPLLFNPDDEEKEQSGADRSEAGHFLLVVAERDSKGENIRLQIQDSMTGIKDVGKTQTTARNIVRYSGWMGLNTEGRPVAVEPTFADDMVDSPQQSGGVECGLHVIFNAWAYMLGIPVIRSTQRSGKVPDRRFYMFGRHIINLALTGCMDSETIQAFFNWGGYSQPQNVEDPLTSMEAVSLDDTTFAESIAEIRAVERGEPAAAGPDPGAAGGAAGGAAEDAAEDAAENVAEDAEEDTTSKEF